MDDEEESSKEVNGCGEDDQSDLNAELAVVRSEDPQKDFRKTKCSSGEAGKQGDSDSDCREIGFFEAMDGKSGEEGLDEDGIHLDEDGEYLSQSIECADVSDGGRAVSKQGDEEQRNLALNGIEDGSWDVGHGQSNDCLLKLGIGLAFDPK